MLSNWIKSTKYPKVQVWESLQKVVFRFDFPLSFALLVERFQREAVVDQSMLDPMKVPVWILWIETLFAKGYFLKESRENLRLHVHQILPFYHQQYLSL